MTVVVSDLLYFVLYSLTVVLSPLSSFPTPNTFENTAWSTLFAPPIIPTEASLVSWEYFLKLSASSFILSVLIVGSKFTLPKNGTFVLKVSITNLFPGAKYELDISLPTPNINDPLLLFILLPVPTILENAPENIKPFAGFPEELNTENTLPSKGSLPSILFKDPVIDDPKPWTAAPALWRALRPRVNWSPYLVCISSVLVIALNDPLIVLKLEELVELSPIVVVPTPEVISLLSLSFKSISAILPL